MKAQLRYLHSPDVPDLEKYWPYPEDDFGFLLQVMAGPEDSEGEESFDILVCTPKYLARLFSGNDIVSGRHKTIMFEYNYRRSRGFIDHILNISTGDTWNEVATKLARYGHWEFEDSREYDG